ncbi:GPW/gp25 family protein [Aliiglaciecola sp. CAU 1673]|uniref:GPW/gp25 family protein n=1 Tax=Aliiglaciecola sp. CAU 1673 TaxID=3032595 RepID=UPI0023DA60FD|nr:GPW/gp25 family protein [Aliiglaciecola sp. CAU 1673]MDF2177188.1 GPW/gp25 family protein [Aliiglaciecola sp. CAU 1673]
MAKHGQHDDFLGTGWSFPPAFLSSSRGISTVSDEQDILQSLQILFSTRPGERLMHPKYGCHLHRYVFDAITEHSIANMLDAMRQAVLFFEPRIKLLSITPQLDDLFEGVLRFELTYQIKATNSRHNMVYPFYLQEGTRVHLPRGT